MQKIRNEIKLDFNFTDFSTHGLKNYFGWFSL